MPVKATADGTLIFKRTTSKKLTGHIGFGLCSHQSILSLKTVHARVLKFHIWIPHEKYLTHVFFLVQVLFLSGVMPLWIKSEWSLMHAISYEQCPFEVMPLWKNQNEILSARYRQVVFELGTWTWTADRGCWIGYLIKFKKKNHLFSGVMSLWKFGLCKICQQVISKIIWAWGLKIDHLIGDDV